MDSINFEVQGMKEFADAVDKLVKNMAPDKIEPVLKKGASIFAKGIRARAPVGKTGKLRKAVRIKKLQRWGKQPAPYIAAIDRKKAPHAFIVMRGTSGVRMVKPPRRVLINGRPATITNTGTMPPNTFFQDGVRAKSGEVLRTITDAVGKLLDEGMK